MGGWMDGWMTRYYPLPTVFSHELKMKVVYNRTVLTVEKISASRQDRTRAAS